MIITRKYGLWLLFLLASCLHLQAEGSKDFVDYPGYRLFYNAEQRQQLKVYAAEGETINLGTSHLGISGGFISIYRPDGSLHYVYNGSEGVGLINNHLEERAGPTGGGTTNGSGYIPATVDVGTGQAGIWTVRFEYPTYSRDEFTNLLNNAPWDRFDQPVDQRVVLAWDITVSQNGAANMGGTMVEGRVYSNEYISIQNGNAITTSPTFYILTRDGFQYKIDFKDTDPWGFPIFSNTTGLVTPDGNPCYQSSEQADYNRSGLTNEWTRGNKYLYEPQAEDEGNFINNKIFFNPPDPNMPAMALVTDMLTFNTHTTWLFQELKEINPEFDNVTFAGIKSSQAVCEEDFVSEMGMGGLINFNVNTSGTAKLSLDFNNNGQFDDPVDKTYVERVELGENSVRWDGRDGLNSPIGASINFQINYKLEIRAAEIHIMMLDVENNPGGVAFTRLNGSESPSQEFYYDHSRIGGGVSGGGEAGKPLATSEPYTYSQRFGNNRLLDYWSFIEYPSSENGGFSIDIISDCSQPIIDTDGDRIPDFMDLDDDNDGIADFSEYCNPEGDFTCLPGSVDPSKDSDNDNIPNYLDSSDPAINNDCVDANEDGICDQLSAIYDTDGDGVPDHLDLDSDNDGITDLVEAGHLQLDADGNGVIDGDQSFFGQNGLFNALASDPDAADAFETYNRFDVDQDGVPDHDDLDSDNDGINDVAETLFANSDSNNDGRIDDGAGNPPMVSMTGLTPPLNLELTNSPIPLPPDTDLDGVPDWHDLDSDNDGINDVAESVRLDADNDGILGSGIPMVDIDGKAINDALGVQLATTSRPTNTDKKEAADFRSLDADDDGINDVNEADQPDEDGDGRIGTGTPIVNKKGQITTDAAGNRLNPLSNPEDTDTDQTPDFQDIDRDNDGINDRYECPTGWPCVNSDDDLLPDVDDLDSDNDRLLDNEECPGGAPCPQNESNIDQFLVFDCNPRNTPSPSQAIGGGQVCEGVPLQLSASGDTAFTETVFYTWTGPNDFIIERKAKANSTFPVDLKDTRQAASGTYELTLTTAKGCASEPLKVAVDFMEKPVAPELLVTKNELCVGESIELEVNTFSGEAVQYIWYKQSDGEPIAVDTTNIATLIFDQSETINSGLYTAVVEVNGCASSISNAERIQIKTPIESPVATTSASILNPACEGEKVQLSVPFREGATYEWTGPNGFTADQADPILNNANFLNNGNYSALVTFEGCAVRTNDVAVLVNTKPVTPTLKMEQIKQCEGESATLKIIEPVSYSESSTLRFNWYTIGRTMPISTTVAPSLDLLNLSDADNGDYYVEVSIQGCVSTASNLQSIEVQPTVPVSISSSAEIDNPACAGDMVTLTGQLFTNATYEWFGPNGLVSNEPSTSFLEATPEIDGQYQLVVTIEDCPSKSNTVTVKVNDRPTTPTIELDNTSPCTGENAKISITNSDDFTVNKDFQVNWYNANTDELIETTKDLVWNLQNLENIDDGEYYGVVSVDGCTSENSNRQQITTQPGLAEVFIQTNAEKGVSPVCEGTDVTLTIPAEFGVTYQWFGPNGVLENTTNSLRFDAATTDLSGEYYVVREKAGCTRTSQEIAIQIGQPPITPEVSVMAGPQCPNGEVTFTINNPPEPVGGSEVLYSWYHVQTNEQVGTSTQPIFTLANLSTANNGAYYAILSVNGCTTPQSNTAQISVQAPNVELVATASAGVDAPVCAGETVSLNVPFEIGATYEWFGPNGFTANVPNPSIPAISAADAGNYYAVVTSTACPVITNEISLQVNPKPTTPNLVIDKTENCEGETAVLTVTKPTVFPEGTDVTYEWFDTKSDVPLATTNAPIFEKTNLVANENSSLYAVVQQDGCQSDISNEVQLAVSAIPEEIAFIEKAELQTCSDSEVKIEALTPQIGVGKWLVANDLTIVDPSNPSTFLLDIPAE
ncbi:MAG: hypothetical protein AAGJ18_03385, partial [Bacteroidota bacterium]